MTATAERTTPHSLDAEKTVLGCALFDTDAALEVVDSVRAAGVFFRPAHQHIHRAVQALVTEHQPVDLLTVKTWLEQHGKLDEVGGPAYLSSLVDGIPRRSNLTGYLAILHDCALRRRLLAAGRKVLGIADDTERDARAALDAAQAELFNVTDDRARGDLVPVEMLVPETHGQIEKLLDTKAGVTGLSTGFIDLDDMTRGLQRSNLIIIASRPSMGKTAFALNIAANLATRSRMVAFFSLEMSRQELMLRLVSAVGRINGHQLQAGYVHVHEFPSIGEALSKIGNWPLWIDDTSSVSTLDVRARLRRVATKARIDCVFVDYLQLMAAERRYENRVLEVGALSRALKALAKDLDVPVVALCQLSRATETRSDHKPQLSDLRESGSLEQDADVVLLLYRAEVYDPTTPGNMGVAEVIISKQRNGPTGTVSLAWIKEQMRFENLDSTRTMRTRTEAR